MPQRATSATPVSLATFAIFALAIVKLLTRS
jgi:hypothetical protein